MPCFAARLSAALFALALVLCLAAPALAHRVNIFAYAENGRIKIHASFGKSQPVQGGAVEVYDASGAKLANATTDDKGECDIPIPQAAAASGSDLKVVVVAGEGHRNEWLLTAADYLPALGATAPQAETEKVTPEPAPVAEPASKAAPQAAPQVIDEARLEEALGRVLDKKLAPLTHMLAQSANQSPGLTEIIGGIGWIFGLVGVAAYFRSRRG